jgi:hypothetical protein
MSSVQKVGFSTKIIFTGIGLICRGFLRFLGMFSCAYNIYLNIFDFLYTSEIFIATMTPYYWRMYVNNFVKSAGDVKVSNRDLFIKTAFKRPKNRSLITLSNHDSSKHIDININSLLTLRKHWTIR